MMRVIYNQGDQRISVVPISRDGAPVVVDSGTDVTCTIVDLREHDQATAHTVLAETVVSQDTFSATLTADAGFSQVDPHNLPADASAAVVGRTYLLEASDGRRETVTLSAIGGTSSATSALPLRSNYETGDTLRGVELSATFPSAEADDEDSVESMGGPYLVTWTYVTGGDTVVLPTTLWVDRYSIAPPIDEAWVLRADPTLASRSRGRTSPAQAISVAWDEWLSRLQSTGKDPSTYPPGHSVKVELRRLAIAYLLRWNAGTPEEREEANTMEAKALSSMDSILTGRAPQAQVQLTRDTVSHVDQVKGHPFRLS